MNPIKIVGILVVLIVVALSAYMLGKSEGSAEVTTVKDANPKSLKEIARIESQFDQQQLDLTNRVAETQNQIKTVKLNLGLREADNEIQSVEIRERLVELDERLANSQTQYLGGSVPIPADSPSGKLMTQPRTASGIPTSVLQNYQQETGVSPSEIEELMRRTE